MSIYLYRWHCNLQRTYLVRWHIDRWHCNIQSTYIDRCHCYLQNTYLNKWHCNVQSTYLDRWHWRQVCSLRDRYSGNYRSDSYRCGSRPTFPLYTRLHLFSKQSNLIFQNSILNHCVAKRNVTIQFIVSLIFSKKQSTSTDATWFLLYLLSLANLWVHIYSNDFIH